MKRNTIRYKKRKGFCRKVVAEDVPVNINPDVNSFVNNDSTRVNITVHSNVDMSIVSNNISTASSRKIEPINASTPTSTEPITGNRIIDMEVLGIVFNMFPCPSCSKVELKLSENISKKKGLASLLIIQCQACSFFHEFYTSLPSDHNSFDVNKRIVYGMRACGQGYAGLQTFTSLMNIPKPMTANNYDKIILKLSTAAKEVAEETMKEACEELRQAPSSDTSSVIDTDVSCDGTWQRRGFSSLNGVVAAISMKTGKILDIEAMSRACKACNLKEHLKKEDPLAYANWKETHVCNFNYRGSAGNMEVVGAKRIWERSIEKNKLRYTTFYGDGDSKGYLGVCDVYPGIKVEKMECVGHVQKRVGCRLRNLKKKEKGLGGKGKLTNNMVDRLQNFYGIAIRQNKNNIKNMQSAVRATLFHVASSKENNWHYPHCPEGSDSWCKYNQDVANKTHTYKPGPGLPLPVVMKLKPIFEELSNEKLLQKCVHGLTQNQNESFNATIWERIPKTRFVSRTQLEFAVNDAVANFNIGRKSSVVIFEKLCMIPGRYTLKGCQHINKRRLFNSVYKSMENSKKRRKIIRGNIKKKDDKEEEKDGESYAAGAY